MAHQADTPRTDALAKNLMRDNSPEFDLLRELERAAAVLKADRDALVLALKRLLKNHDALSQIPDNNAIRGDRWPECAAQARDALAAARKS